MPASRRYRATAVHDTRELSSSENSEGTSGSEEEEDEEKSIGRHIERRSTKASRHMGRAGGKGERVWAMRSVPKGSRKYNRAQQDDYSDDDAGGGKGDRTPPSSDGEKSDKPGYSSDEQCSRDEKGGSGKTKRGAAGAGQQDGEDQQDEESSNKKLWWIAAGVAVIVVLLLIGGWYWYSHRDSSSSIDSSSSAAISSAPATSSAAVQPSTTASAPVTTSPLLTAPPRTSAFPTSTDTAVQPGQTYFAQITWLEASGELSECGTKAKDTDLVVRVSEELYGDASAVSPLCGQFITMYQLEKDSYVRATIEGISGNITGHNLDLSQAAFKGLTSSLKLGTTLVQWYLTDDKHKPKASLKSYPVGGSGGGASETGGTALTNAVMPTKA